MPVAEISPYHFKEAPGIGSNNGAIGLMNSQPHPSAAKVFINWYLSREGQIAYHRVFTTGEEGPDSLRIDIPKDKVPRGNRRPEGADENRYPFVDRAEWMDQEPFRKFVREVLEQRRK